jgi:outer membrane lipopolysaccharide assembly protein LptE/RlpB
MHKKLYFILFFLTLSLQSCGFHLKAPLSLHKRNTSIAVVNQSGDQRFNYFLLRHLKDLNINITSPDRAKVIINILDFRHSTQTGAISSSTNTRQYQLIQELNFSVITNKGKTLVPPNWVSTNRIFSLNANQILGSDNESIKISTEMMSELASKIFKKVNAALDN